MTREHNFRSSVRMQLSGFAGWSVIEAQDLRKLPTQSFTAFSLELGKMYTVQSDFSGRILQGRQDFTMRIYLRFHQLKPDLAAQFRSEAITILQVFFNSYYAPPVITIGETERIEKAMIDSIEGATIEPSATRHEIIVHGRYYFTQF